MNLTSIKIYMEAQGIDLEFLTIAYIIPPFLLLHFYNFVRLTFNLLKLVHLRTLPHSQNFLKLTYQSI